MDDDKPYEVKSWNWRAPTKEEQQKKRKRGLDMLRSAVQNKSKKRPRPTSIDSSNSVDLMSDESSTDKVIDLEQIGDGDDDGIDMPSSKRPKRYNNHGS